MINPLYLLCSRAGGLQRAARASSAAVQAPCFARRLRHLDLGDAGLGPSPIRSRGEGRLARWARWDRGALGLGFGTSELTLTRGQSDRP
eukprot:11787124-Alexandrium_andersonii.AAC.1